MMAKIFSDENGVLTFNGKKYFIDIDKMKEICINYSDDVEKDSEVTESYERVNDEEGGEMVLSNRIIRDVKTSGNQQNGAILYDFVKLFVVRLIENMEFEKEFEKDFGTVLSINTLINCGIMKLIK